MARKTLADFDELSNQYCKLYFRMHVTTNCMKITVALIKTLSFSFKVKICKTFTTVLFLFFSHVFFSKKSVTTQQTGFAIYSYTQNHRYKREIYPSIFSA